MGPSNLRSQDEQIFSLLSTSSKTYGQIGAEVGCSAATVSSRARKMVVDYGFNPSILRSSKKAAKQYGRYCQNISCHKLTFFTENYIKKNKDFYCSQQCKSIRKIKLPPKQQVESNYRKFGFHQTSVNLKVSYGFLAKIFEHYNIEPVDFPENVLVTPATIAQRQTQRIKQRRNPFSNTRSGMRPHLGHVCRSSWENNFALYLVHKKIPYTYESKVFHFEEKTNPKSYVPDFFIELNGKEIIVEVKGRYMSKDGTKAKRMKKYYPDTFKNLTYVVNKEGSKADLAYKAIGMKPFLYYDDIVKEYSGKLKNWES